MSRPHSATINYIQKACALVAKTIRHQSRESQDGASASTDPINSPDVDVQKEFLLSVAQQLWKHHPDGYVRRDNPESNSVNTGRTAPSKARTSAEVHLPCCHVCGMALQPGYDGTNVRIKSQRKKRRRRKPISSELTKTLSKVGDGGLADKWDSEDSRALRACRNYLVITCSCCQSKCRIPGLPRNAGEKSTSAIMSTKAKNASMKVDDKTLNAAGAIPPNQRQDFEQAVNSGLDFVPLSGKSAPQQSITASDNKRKIDSPSSSLLPLQNQPKKKKKEKQPKKPSSQLRDFLSSLND